MIHSTEERREKNEEDDEKVEMSALEVGESDIKKQKDDDGYADFINIIKVNGKEVQALYDTALRRELVKNDQYIDKSVLCRLHLRMVRIKERYPIAKVEIDGEYYNPVSTGIFPHSLPEWAFRARPGLWRICLCPKVARIAEQKFGSR